MGCPNPDVQTRPVVHWVHTDDPASTWIAFFATETRGKDILHEDRSFWRCGWTVQEDEKGWSSIVFIKLGGRKWMEDEQEFSFSIIYW
ncbi:hypothetical protein CEXT_40361 [Caerostris extrusa]|uniref:Uncharacterized protein n=1 Tax=Caerostris extrusa TaxID=172846 RepID=A0AAV4YAF6_CAEEX|nr:hypothetical protein CEXT_40361 [Caerostris extrusa]